MTPSAEEQLEELVTALSKLPGIERQLPDPPRRVIEGALSGKTVYEIAQDERMTEATIWKILGDAARMATGQSPTQRPETGGLGGDTDPGVTGGYGDSAFGSIGNEPPLPSPQEPPVEMDEGQERGQGIDAESERYTPSPADTPSPGEE